MRLFDLPYLMAAPPCAAAASVRYLRTGKAVADWRAKISGRVDVPAPAGERLWLHAVSVGEVLQVKPLLRELHARRPNLDVVLSVSTASGLKLARETDWPVTVVPFPFDFSWAVSTAFEAIRPSAVCLVELEVWPNFVAEAADRGVPVVVANGRLSERSFRGYRRAGRLLRPTFTRLQCVAAQTGVYAGRFTDLGCPRVEVTGSIKFDGLKTNRDAPAVRQLRDALGFTSTDRVIVAGSTHDPEESIALRAYETLRQSHDDVRLLVVPRHPERFDGVAKVIADRGHAVTRRSGGPVVADSVRLLDTVGELSAAWGLADLAFVGGTLCDRGGQNMLEPAAYGSPTLVGPDVRNFADIAKGLIDSGGGETVRSAEELATSLDHLLTKDARRLAMSQAAGEFARSQSGAAAHTADLICEHLPTASAAMRRSA